MLSVLLYACRTHGDGIVKNYIICKNVSSGCRTVGTHYIFDSAKMCSGTNRYLFPIVGIYFHHSSITQIFKSPDFESFWIDPAHNFEFTEKDD